MSNKSEKKTPEGVGEHVVNTPHYPIPFALRDTTMLDKKERKRILRMALRHLWYSLPQPDPNPYDLTRSKLLDELETHKFWTEVYDAALKYYPKGTALRDVFEEMGWYDE